MALTGKRTLPESPKSQERSFVLTLVRAAGVEPAWAMPDGFSYHFDFRRRLRKDAVRGLDYPFVIARRP